MNHVELPIVITPTRAQTGASCHRRHFLGDIINVESYRAASLEFGTLMHSGVREHWLGRPWEPVIREEWYNRFEKTSVSQEKVSLDLAMAMMDYYVSNATLAGPLQNAADDWKLVDVEQRFHLPLKDSMVSFQMDRIVYSQKQDWLLIGDLKTAARLDARWEKQWNMSLQMKLYNNGSRKVFSHEGRLDVFIEGLLKDIPAKLRYFLCPDWSSDVLGEAAMNALHVANLDKGIVEQCKLEDGSFDLALAEELGVAYTTTNERECFSYGVECPFYKVCIADVNERVGILRGEFTEKAEEDY